MQDQSVFKLVHDTLGAARMISFLAQEPHLSDADRCTIADRARHLESILVALGEASSIVREEPVDVSLHELIFQCLPNDENIAISLERPEECLNISAGHFRMALLQIIGNAHIHALPKMCLSHQTLAIDISSKRHLRFTTIEVSDNGPGLNDAELRLAKRPFERFGQHAGKGLGLYKVGKILEAYGGWLSLHHGDGREHSGLRVTMAFKNQTDHQKPATPA